MTGEACTKFAMRTRDKKSTEQIADKIATISKEQDNSNIDVGGVFMCV